VQWCTLGGVQSHNGRRKLVELSARVAVGQSRISKPSVEAVLGLHHGKRRRYPEEWAHDVVFDEAGCPDVTQQELSIAALAPW
jgi:hypothetical protein